MLALRPLPPQFLLPSWTSQHLRELQRVHTKNVAATSRPGRHGRAPSTTTIRSLYGLAGCADRPAEAQRSIAGGIRQASRPLLALVEHRRTPGVRHMQKRNVSIRRYLTPDSKKRVKTGDSSQPGSRSGNARLHPDRKGTLAPPAQPVEPTASTKPFDFESKVRGSRRKSPSKAQSRQQDNDNVQSPGGQVPNILQKERVSTSSPVATGPAKAKDGYVPFPTSQEQKVKQVNVQDEPHQKASAASHQSATVDNEPASVAPEPLTEQAPAKKDAIQISSTPEAKSESVPVENEALPREHEDATSLERRAAQLQEELARVEELMKHKRASKIEEKESTSYRKSERQVSLLEQLFPEDVVKQKPAQPSPRDSSSAYEDIPRLELPSLEPLNLEPTTTDRTTIPRSPDQESPTELYKERDLTIMVISGLSTTLSNADFQRLIPRGQHIEEWRAIGDVLKVIPLRDPMSLAPLGNYLLVFVNPSYARAFKTRIEALHELSQQHSPTTTGTLHTSRHGSHVEQAEIQQALSDYSLCPSSSHLNAQIIFPPYTARLRRILADKGYEQLMQPEDVSGRAALVWVDGHRPSLLSMERWLKRDGARRGVPWSPLVRKDRLRRPGRPTLLKSDGPEEAEEAEEDELSPERVDRGWMLVFDDESEARRFIRMWHKRPWPAKELELQDRPDNDEDVPLVNVELLW